MHNIPDGAADDPNAPWNEPETFTSCCKCKVVADPRTAEDHTPVCLEHLFIETALNCDISLDLRNKALENLNLCCQTTASAQPALAYIDQLENKLIDLVLKDGP